MQVLARKVRCFVLLLFRACILRRVFVFWFIQKYLWPYDKALKKGHRCSQNADARSSQEETLNAMVVDRLKEMETPRANASAESLQSPWGARAMKSRRVAALGNEKLFFLADCSEIFWPVFN